MNYHVKPGEGKKQSPRRAMKLSTTLNAVIWKDPLLYLGYIHCHIFQQALQWTFKTQDEHNFEHICYKFLMQIEGTTTVFP